MPRIAIVCVLALACGKSSMPEDLLKYLTKAELRDLIEFLAGLK